MKKKIKNIIKAHEATGHVTMHEHTEKMHRAVNKAIQGDVRFNAPKAGSPNGIGCSPYCCDITTPDGDGQHHAIIRTAAGELVRHGFDFNKDEGTATLLEGNSAPTESTRIYATAIERHDNMVQAMENMLSCRATSGVKLTASEKWEPEKPVSFIYAPAGITQISAGFRQKESITCSVLVDEQTALDLQESFDFVAATNKQVPFADEDHESKKATLRFPAGTKFVYGTLRGEEGIMVQGAEPTSYGAEAVNGKVYASWSPEFALDADYTKAKCKKGHWTFPDGVRGSASNPARMVAVNFVTGALTNKPAFKNMPPVKAKAADAPIEDETPDADATVTAAGTSEGAKLGWEKRVRGGAHLVMHMEDAQKIAKLGGGHYIASTRDGLKGGAHHISEHKEHSKTVEDAASYINDRVQENNTANKHDEDAVKKPHPELHDRLGKAIAHMRDKFSFGDAKISRAYGEGIKIGGEDYHKHAAKTNPSGVQATATPDDAATIKAAEEAAAAKLAAEQVGNTELDAILARHDQDMAALDILACRVPQTATRAAMEAIYARQSGQVPAAALDKQAEILKAAAKEGGHLVTKDGESHLPTHKNGKADHHLMGAAWAALHGGYRGNKYEGPDKAEAIKKLSKLYKEEGMETPSESAKATATTPPDEAAYDAKTIKAVILPPDDEDTLEKIYARMGVNA